MICRSSFFVSGSMIRNLRWFVELSALWKQEIDRQGQNGSQIRHFFAGEFLPNWNKPRTLHQTFIAKTCDALWGKSNACRGLLVPTDSRLVLSRCVGNGKKSNPFLGWLRCIMAISCASGQALSSRQTRARAAVQWTKNHLWSADIMRIAVLRCLDAFFSTSKLYPCKHSSRAVNVWLPSYGNWNYARRMPMQCNTRQTGPCVSCLKAKPQQTRFLHAE